MLILARKVKERILVPSIDMTITVVRVAGDTVRLGIEAPEGVVILREEVESNTPVTSLVTQLMQQREEKHSLRNTLATARTGLHLLDKQIEAGAAPEALRRTIWMIASGFNSDDKPEDRIETPAPPAVSALLVEDQPNEREMLASILTMGGFNIFSSASGEDAMRYLDQSKAKPDVLLLDMGLPGMKGEDVVRQVRDNPANKDMKIFVISGRDKKEGMAVDRWFTKPLNPTLLLQNLSSLRSVG